MKRKIYQSFNNRNNSWVKYKCTSKGNKILNVKERNPTKKFKGIPVKKK